MTIRFKNSNIDICLKKEKLQEINKILNNKYKSNMGWQNIERIYSTLDKIEKTAEYIRNKFDLVLVCGVGGSYLGARGVIQAIQGDYRNIDRDPRIVFVGNNLSASRYLDTIKMIDDCNACVIAISKSGNTTETSLALDIISNKLMEKYKNIDDRVYIVTNEKNGRLRNLCKQYNYTNFLVEEDVGGRYSVLTSVGLFPIAVAGINIRELLKGAINYRDYLHNCSIEENYCYQYALTRRALKGNNKDIEILCSYNPDLEFFFKWYVQLFGESEGKCEEAIFPSYLIYTQDLHSMGQYIQEGPKRTFETVIEFGEENVDIVVDLEQIDSYYKGLRSYSMNKLNRALEKATKIAHSENDVKTISIKIDKLDEYNLGQLLYFFMYSCAISSVMLNVNPFNQPGVEKYKSLFKELIK